MEEEIEPYKLQQAHWQPVGPTALPESVLKKIATLLVSAKELLIITGYSGRNHAAVTALVSLADTVKGIRVLDTGGSDMCFPANHPGWLGMCYGNDDSIRTADVIIVLDCDVPWINTQCMPSESAQIIHIDQDPLKTMMPVFYLSAIYRYCADAETSCNQLTAYIKSHPKHSQTVTSAEFASRWQNLQHSHAARLSKLKDLAQPNPDNSYGASYLARTLRRIAPQDAIYAIEAVTNAVLVSDQIQAALPGQWITAVPGALDGAEAVLLVSRWEQTSS